MLIKAACAYAPNCRKRYESLCPTTQSQLTWGLGAQLMLGGKTEYRNGPVARKRRTEWGRSTLTLCYQTIYSAQVRKKSATSWSGARNPVLEQENCLPLHLRSAHLSQLPQHSFATTHTHQIAKICLIALGFLQGVVTTPLAT